jgi:molecular chaperone DnaK (HSP70)
MADLTRVFGIDLGTTYSAVAHIDEFDRPTVVPNDINEPTTPSAVYFESEDNVVVGVEARNMAEIEPEAVVQFVKRFMGRRDEFLFEHDGRQYEPEEISAIILKGLVEKARQTLDDDVTDVVITVPAYFDEAQRVATRNAGVMAGLNVLDIVNEPIAAAFSYGVQNKDTEETILVYDLGGGTFDVSVIRVDSEGVRILVTGGNHELGGKDWDDRLINWLATAFEEENGVNPLTDPHAHQELRMKAESVKKRLSQKMKDPFTFSFAGNHSRIEVTREKLEEITADLLDQTVQVTKETIEELKEKVGSDSIHRILLVGGSSLMPMVKERIDSEFGVESQIHDPAECVAKGAAVWAVKARIDNLAQSVGYDTQTGDGDKQAFDEVLEAEMDDLSVRDREFYLGLPGKTGGNVSSHTYGLLAWDQGMEIVVPLITRNSEIPFILESQPGQFGTAENNQTTIEIVMMESDGDSLDPDDCKEIGRGTVELPPGIPRGSEVEIRFDYAGDGTMMLAAREVTSNSECEVAIVRNGIMDPDQVVAAGNQLAVMVAG